MSISFRHNLIWFSINENWNQKDYIDSLSKNIGSVQKNSKKAAGIEKKIAFARNNSFRGYYL
jgi:hypothetical protein